MTRPIDWDAVHAHRATWQPPLAKCSHPDCGLIFTPTADGRLRHKVMCGHAPRVWVAPPPPDAATTRKCSHGYHDLCGGGLIHRGEPTVCACRCHESEAR